MRCKECRERLVHVSAGYVCPNGHGRIIPFHNRRLMMEYLPEADTLNWMNLQWIYLSDGMIYVRCKARHPQAEELVINGKIKHFCRNELIEKNIIELAKLLAAKPGGQ
jgi:hypothetical protein